VKELVLKLNKVGLKIDEGEKNKKRIPKYLFFNYWSFVFCRWCKDVIFDVDFDLISVIFFYLGTSRILAS
jgi:hypothetical protein